MGKSSDSRSEVRERVTDANKVPLGRPSFFSGTKPSGASSLLKPSYLHHEPNERDSSGSNSSSHTSGYSGMSLNFSNLNQHIAGMSHSGGSAPSTNSLKQATDYSRWSDGSYSGFSQKSSTISSSKRENDDSNDSFGAGGEDQGRERKRKRRSRWMGGTDEKAVIPGMPTILPSDLPPDQQEAYIGLLHLSPFMERMERG